VRRSRLSLLPRAGGVLAMAIAALSMGGCSSSQTDDVSAAAEGFYAEVASRDGPGACALLSAATRTELEQSAGKACGEAVLEESIPDPDQVEPARVYGTMAIVSAGADTMFLSRFPEGWLVIAVGCDLTDRADRYDCSVEGS
jgi:hypothetical protein